MATAPALEQVLANVVRGRGQRLRLSEEQRRGLQDRDGLVACRCFGRWDELGGRCR
jgi:hypothetical protein